MSFLSATNQANSLLLRIRLMIIFFMISLLISGITAFPIEWELKFMTSHPELFPDAYNDWFAIVYEGIKETNAKYPFLSYGTDWLGFAHITIAVFFIGVLKDPVRNSWIVISGMIISLMVFPHSFIFGHMQQIPVIWRLVDCSFGFFSFILLWVCYRHIKKLELVKQVATHERDMKQT
jgi:hypothetical protein